MAVAINVDKKMEQVRLEVSRRLKNNAYELRHNLNLHEDCFEIQLKLANREAFGDTIRVKVDFDKFHKMDFIEITKTMLACVLDCLPRADRLERARVWGIKA